jgi:cellulose synthase (UDP-forming)
VAAMLETIGFTMAHFKVTPKNNITRTTFLNKFNLIWVQITLAALSLVAIIKIIVEWTTVAFVPSHTIILFWLSYNLYLLSMAIFFASERPKFRAAERMLLNANAEIDFDGTIYGGTTYDISETGVSIIFDRAFYVEPGSARSIRIHDEKHSAGFIAELAHVSSVDQEYRYAFRITQIDEEDLQKLILIIYDRVPQIVQEFQKSNAYSIIAGNFKGRLKHWKPMNRKLPRITVNREFTAYCGRKQTTIYVHDFNFTYCTVSSAKRYKKMRIPLGLNSMFVLKCTLNDELSNRNQKGVLVYEVSNYRKFINNSEIAYLLTNGEKAIFVEDENIGVRIAT